MDKIEARKIALELRKNKDSIAISKKIVNDIIESNMLDKFNHIGIYYPIKNEIDITALVDYYRDKSFYLPKTKDEISFGIFKKGDILVDGKFKTKEPISKDIDRDVMDCIIVPCVGISNNQRIGYGKGYYDRFFQRFDITSVGLCYEMQLSNSIIPSKYDRPMDIIITERNTYVRH